MKQRQNYAIAFIFLTVFIDVVGFGIIIPVIPKLLENLLGISVVEASTRGGWLMFAYALTHFISAPVLGEFSDRFGRRPVLMVSLAGLSADYLLHAYAPTFYWLLIGRILAGMCGASYTVANAYIADISTRENKARNFGIIGAAFGLGFIIGPAIGSTLSAYWGIRSPFIVAAIFTFMNLIFGIFVLPESLDKSKRRKMNLKSALPINTLRKLWHYPHIGLLLFGLFLSHIGSYAVQSTWSFFTMYRFGWEEKEVGYSLSLAGVVVAIAQAVLVKQVVKRFGEQKSVIFGFLLMIGGLIAFALVPTGTLLLIVLIPYCMSGIYTPPLQSIISNRIADDRQGELQGTLTSLMSLAAIGGPPVMTGIFRYFSSETAPIHLPGAAFVLAALVSIIALLLIIRTFVKIDQHPVDL